jgi:hypothetical protein
MSLLRQSVVWAACTAAVCAQARADDVAPQPKPAHASKAKPKPAAQPRPQPDGLSEIQFSNPYALPEGTAGTKAADFPAARLAPTEPKGDVSFSYKWHATNEPVDLYNAVRHSAGPDGPGDTFMGGLKLGF